jgi:hypothetical protein
VRPAPYHASGQQDLLNYSQLRCGALSMVVYALKLRYKTHAITLWRLHVRGERALVTPRKVKLVKSCDFYLSVGCVRLFSACTFGKEAVTKFGHE